MVIRRDEDDWDEIFRELYEEFGLDMRKINNEIARFWESVMKDPDKIKISGPYVYGFSYKIGPDGKPVFQEFGNVPGRRSLYEEREGYREPLTDINEDKNNIYVTFELPGVNKEDISLTVSDNSMTLSVDKGARKYYKNINFDSEVDSNKVTAKFTNGILDVTVQKKKSESSGRSVKID